MNVSICLAKSKGLLIAGLALSMLGCANTAFVVPEHLPAASTLSEGASVSESVGSSSAQTTLPASKRLPALEVSKWEKGDVDSKWDALGLTDTEHDLNVESLPLNEFVQVALGDVLGLSFVVDPVVQSKRELVTLRISKPMKAIRFLDTVEQLLSAYGTGLSYNSGTLQVLPSSKLTSMTPTFVTLGSKAAIQQGKIITIIPLRYSTPDEVMRFARHFLQIGQTADIQSMKRLNSILAIGNAAKVEKFQRVVEMIDRPSMESRKIQLIRATYLQADEIIDLLSDALKIQGVAIATSAEAPGVYLTEVKQLNSFMVAAPDDAVLNWINEWVREMDTPAVAGDSLRSFVYLVKHSSAKELGEVVSAVLGGLSVKDSGTARSQSAGKDTVSSLSGGGSNLRLVVDEAHNALVFVGSAQSYNAAYQLLEQIDVPSKQVLLEVTVADVTLENNTQLGIEWEFENSGSDGVLDGGGGTLGRLGIGTGGFTYTAFDASSNIRARLNTLATKGEAKILSSPRLLAVDNEEARIQVGTQIAVISSENTSETVDGIIRSFNYVDTGVILSFTPTVMAGGDVRLQVSQEVSSPGPSVNNTPPINTRSVETTLIAQSGSTIMIGGLISSTDTVNDEQVPILGDIPIFGALFKGREVIDNSTEMVVLITPHIIESSSQIESLTESFRSQIGW